MPILVNGPKPVVAFSPVPKLTVFEPTSSVPPLAVTENVEEISAVLLAAHLNVPPLSLTVDIPKLPDPLNTNTPSLILVLPL